MDESDVLEALKNVEDPEAGMSIVDLGLIYAIEERADGVRVEMTLTSPSCPMGPMLVDEVIAAVRGVLPGTPDVQVDLVWDPPWTPERMSEAAQARFGWTQ